MKTAISLGRPAAAAGWPATRNGSNGTSAMESVVEEARSESSVQREDLFSPRWLFTFIGLEFACRCALLFQAIAPMRVFVRVAAFLGSIAYVFILQKSVRSHPSGRLAIVVLVILAASILHPETSSAWAGVAAVFLHLAVLAPIFWVPRLRIDLKTVRTLFFVFWAFHTASAAFGALQVYYPGRFQPALSTAIANPDGLLIVLADGSTVFRPMGLTDTPGGAAIGGTYSVLLGTGFLALVRDWRKRLPFVVSLAVGLFALYLCQVRSLLVMVGLAVLATGVPFAAQRKLGTFTTIAGTVFGVAIGAFFMAVAVGGQAVIDRMSTLIADDPATVYYSNRGFFLHHTFSELIPQYPIGAGLGRWGMIASYFGETASHALWAEVQWTAWLYDGGILLMVIYGATVAVALKTAYTIATQRTGGSDELRLWATVLFGYSLGAFATTFNGCPFEGDLGIDFWILNATVFAASRQFGGAAPAARAQSNGAGS